MQQLFMALVAEYVRLTLDTPGTVVKYSFALCSLAVRGAAKESFRDVVMLCCVASSFDGRSRIGMASAMKFASTDGTVFNHVTSNDKDQPRQARSEATRLTSAAAIFWVSTAELLVILAVRRFELRARRPVHAAKVI